MGCTPQYLDGLDPVGGGAARVDRQQRGEQLVQRFPPLCPAQVVDQGGDATLVKIIDYGYSLSSSGSRSGG